MSKIQKPAPKVVTHGNAAGEAAVESRISDLLVSASLMKLDAGLYCLLLARSSAADAKSGLPGMRLNPAPGPDGRPEAVEIRTISPDGWMSGFGDAALVRVVGGSANVLVTIYRSPGSPPEGAPNLQVLPLLTGETGAPRTLALANASQSAPLDPLPTPTVPTPRIPVDIVAHIQTRGDVGAKFGEWLGVRGSGKWIEGFGIAPTNGMDLADIEYQVVLGRGWMSPWVEGGQFCGSRGMALPMLGLRVRLRGPAADAFELRYSASFVDGTTVGPVAGGEACECLTLSAVEALMIELTPIGALSAQSAATKPAAKGKPAAKAAR